MKDRLGAQRHLYGFLKNRFRRKRQPFKMIIKQQEMYITVVGRKTNNRQRTVMAQPE